MFVGTASFMKNVVCFAVVVPARSPVYGFTICFDESELEWLCVILEVAFEFCPLWQAFLFGYEDVNERLARVVVHV